MEIRERQLSQPVCEALLALSAQWEAENSCHGYRKNGYSDLEGRRIFTAEEQGEIIGYLFGKLEKAERASSVMPEGTDYFEAEELYVRPDCRSRGVGSALFRYAEAHIRPEASYLLLSTATKNFRAVLHLYVDELGMEFWNARLFKKL